MLCHQCGGRLEGDHTVCSFCGVHQRIDLREVHFRDLGPSDLLPCPTCQGSLHTLKTTTEPGTHLEHCPTCHGLFFNPGELEAILEENAPGGLWLDAARIEALAEKAGPPPGEITYRKCPHCRDIMTRINFGGRSGVIIDRCTTHGVWLDHGELHHLLQWWHAGGRLIHQRHAAEGYRPPTPSTSLPDRTLETMPVSPFGEMIDKWDFIKIAGALVILLLKVLK